MKDRILRLLKRRGAMDYYQVWRNDLIYKAPLQRDGFCHEWNYYTWAGMAIHHNIETDRLTCFCDGKRWEE